MRGQRGFTLIELLVVMAILGLLAAVAAPSFFSQKDKTYDAAAKATVRSAATAIATYATDHAGEYSGATVADLQLIEPTLQGANLAIAQAGTDSYEVEVTSVSGNVFAVERLADGTSTYMCATGGSAGCPPSGAWAD